MIMRSKYDWILLYLDESELTFILCFYRTRYLHRWNRRWNSVRLTWTELQALARLYQSAVLRQRRRWRLETQHQAATPCTTASGSYPAGRLVCRAVNRMKTTTFSTSSSAGWVQRVKAFHAGWHRWNLESIRAPSRRRQQTPHRR